MDAFVIVYFCIKLTLTLPPAGFVITFLFAITRILHFPSWKQQGFLILFYGGTCHQESLNETIVFLFFLDGVGLWLDDSPRVSIYILPIGGRTRWTQAFIIGEAVCSACSKSKQIPCDIVSGRIQHSTKKCGCQTWICTVRGFNYGVTYPKNSKVILISHNQYTMRLKTIHALQWFFLLLLLIHKRVCQAALFLYLSFIACPFSVCFGMQESVRGKSQEREREICFLESLVTLSLNISMGLSLSLSLSLSVSRSFSHSLLLALIISRVYLFLFIFLNRQTFFGAGKPSWLL